MLKTIQKGMELGASMTLDILSFGFTAVEGESMTRRTLRRHHEERMMDAQCRYLEAKKHAGDGGASNENHQTID